MKITLVLGYLAKGGTERQVAYLSSELARRGHSVRILLLGQHLEDEYPVAAGVQVVALQITKLRHCIAGWRQLRAAFRNSDLVYSFLDIANAFCALAKPQRSAPLVWGLRAANTSAGLFSQLGLWLSQRLVSCADAMVANSRAVQTYYQSQGIGGARLSVIANGVPFVGVAEASKVDPNPQPKPSLGSLRAELALPDNAFIALVLARAAAEKRQELGLELLRQYPNLYLVFAGDGTSTLSKQWQSQALATPEMLKRCRFLEHQPDVGRLLDEVDVLLSLSLIEGFPNSVLEAMAHGVPVVATAVGGVVELLADADGENSECGWLVAMHASLVGAGHKAPKEATQELVQALIEALIAVQAGGPEVQRRIRTAQQRVADRYSVEQMVTSTEVLLRQLVRAEPKPA